MVREHGAWVMLCTPAVMALASPGRFEAPLAMLLLALSMVALFLAQEGWRLWLAGRRRIRARTRRLEGPLAL